MSNAKAATVATKTTGATTKWSASSIATTLSAAIMIPTLSQVSPRLSEFIPSHELYALMTVSTAMQQFITTESERADARIARGSNTTILCDSGTIQSRLNDHQLARSKLTPEERNEVDSQYAAFLLANHQSVQVTGRHPEDSVALQKLRNEVSRLIQRGARDNGGEYAHLLIPVSKGVVYAASVFVPLDWTVIPPVLSALRNLTRAFKYCIQPTLFESRRTLSVFQQFSKRLSELISIAQSILLPNPELVFLQYPERNHEPRSFIEFIFYVAFEWQQGGEVVGEMMKKLMLFTIWTVRLILISEDTAVSMSSVFPRSILSRVCFTSLGHLPPSSHDFLSIRGNCKSLVARAARREFANQQERHDWFAMQRMILRICVGNNHDENDSYGKRYYIPWLVPVFLAQIPYQRHDLLRLLFAESILFRDRLAVVSNYLDHVSKFDREMVLKQFMHPFQQIQPSQARFETLLRSRILMRIDEPYAPVNESDVSVAQDASSTFATSVTSSSTESISHRFFRHLYFHFIQQRKTRLIQVIHHNLLPWMIRSNNAISLVDATTGLSPLHYLCQFNPTHRHIDIFVELLSVDMRRLNSLDVVLAQTNPQGQTLQEVLSKGSNVALNDRLSHLTKLRDSALKWRITQIESDILQILARRWKKVEISDNVVSNQRESNLDAKGMEQASTAISSPSSAQVMMSTEGSILASLSSSLSVSISRLSFVDTFTMLSPALSVFLRNEEMRSLQLVSRQVRKLIDCEQNEKRIQIDQIRQSVMTSQLKLIQKIRSNNTEIKQKQLDESLQKAFIRFMTLDGTSDVATVRSCRDTISTLVREQGARVSEQHHTLLSRQIEASFSSRFMPRDADGLILNYFNTHTQKSEEERFSRLLAFISVLKSLLLSSPTLALRTSPRSGGSRYRHLIESIFCLILNTNNFMNSLRPVLDNFVLIMREWKEFALWMVTLLETEYELQRSSSTQLKYDDTIARWILPHQTLSDELLSVCRVHLPAFRDLFYLGHPPSNEKLVILPQFSFMSAKVNEHNRMKAEIVRRCGEMIKNQSNKDSKSTSRSPYVDALVTIAPRASSYDLSILLYSPHSGCLNCLFPSSAALLERENTQSGDRIFDIMRNWFHPIGIRGQEERKLFVNAIVFMCGLRVEKEEGKDEVEKTHSNNNKSSTSPPVVPLPIRWTNFLLNEIGSHQSSTPQSRFFLRFYFELIKRKDLTTLKALHDAINKQCRFPNPTSVERIAGPVALTAAFIHPPTGEIPLHYLLSHCPGQRRRQVVFDLLLQTAIQLEQQRDDTFVGPTCTPSTDRQKYIKLVLSLRNIKGVTLRDALRQQENAPFRKVLAQNYDIHLAVSDEKQ